VELRNVPATVGRETTKPNGPITIVTTRCYAQGQILVEGDIVEVEENINVNEAPTENEERTEVPIGVARQELIDLTESDDEEDEMAIEDTQSVDSETTEENPHLAAEEAPSDDSYDADRNQPDSPPPYSQEETAPRRRDRLTRLRSPSPPGYVPPPKERVISKYLFAAHLPTQRGGLSTPSPRADWRIQPRRNGLVL
jgi:hypothetical protein